MKNNNSKVIMTDVKAVQYDKAMSFLAKLIEYVDDVDAVLKDVGNHYDADRSYVFELSEDRMIINNTYEWNKDGIESQIDNLQNIPYESVAKWFDEFERVGAFYISSLDKDVETNSLTYEILEPQGIESLITAPIYKNNRIVGFIGVDNPHKNIDDVVILKTTASIIYGEISRKIAKKNQDLEKITKDKLQQDEELGEIKDIIASANMGTWRIELVDNEEPRMYADETMKKLLGTSDSNSTPEKVYNDWFSNIMPEALASVLNSVSRMEQGKFDENTYLWKHPTKGVRYVRCGGTAKVIPGGFSLQGYHYDVDEVVRKNQAQMLKLQKALDDRKEYFGALDSLGDLFYSMHVVDLVNDTVIELKARDKVKELSNQCDKATDLMVKVMSEVTVDEYKEEALIFTDLQTLPKRMQNIKLLSKELIGKDTGWFNASFITIDKDENNIPTKVIYTTRVIDEAKKQTEKLIYTTKTDEMTGLLNRRAYEEKIYEHNDIPLEDEFIYVSLDANGLKVVNDTLGHSAGDELLIGLSQCMKKTLGQYGDLYRIGGDEFVAVLFCDEKKAKAILNDFDNLVSKWSGDLIDGLTVSYGWVNKREIPDSSTRQLAAIAEQRMYAAKDEYYHEQGVDRRGQHEAHKALCELYTKILKINISDDTYQIVNMNSSEQTIEKGYSNKISKWLYSFGKSGCVHPDDLSEYLRLTDLNYIKKYFEEGKTSLHVFYRRKYEMGFKQVMMEIIPASDYSKNNQSLFLYVKDIDQ